MQIAQDFAALRQWINANKNLKQETRRYLLLLDSIRRCEGVAKLLLSKQGEMLDVRPARNKVAPINVGKLINHLNMLQQSFSVFDRWHCLFSRQMTLNKMVCNF